VLILSGLFYTKENPVKIFFDPLEGLTASSNPQSPYSYACNYAGIFKYLYEQFPIKKEFRLRNSFYKLCCFCRQISHKEHLQSILHSFAEKADVAILSIG